MTHAWIGVASRDHVAAAVDGEFCQLNHGKLTPLRQLHPGDHIVYYAPREQMRTGADLKAFVAIGRIQPGEPYQLRTSATFKPFRRSAVFYHGGRDAPIHPLLSLLSFTRDRDSWGQLFRRGAFRIEPSDLAVIAAAMAVSFA